MGWFHVVKGRLEYRGRLTREPFSAWASTQEAAPTIEGTAAGIRFAFLGRERAARRQVWRTLDTAVASGAAVEAIGAEAAHHLKLLSTLAYVPVLPRVTVGLHRLVVVPRTMIAGRGYAALCARLSNVRELAPLPEPVRAFLFEQILREMDFALHSAAPSPRRPVLAHDEWVCVGTDLDLLWVDPMWSGPGWGGHLFMFEQPRAGLGRKDLKALDAALAEMKKSIEALSGVQRDGLLRSARAS
jgi:hypothetical protein